MPAFCSKELFLPSQAVCYTNIHAKIVEKKGPSVPLLTKCIETSRTLGELSHNWPFDLRCTSHAKLSLSCITHTCIHMTYWEFVLNCTESID